MDKNDLQDIKNIVDSALETHLASVHEEMTDLRNDMVTKQDLSELETRLGAKIDQVDKKLSAFENTEVDKRKQLEVRVTRIEKHVGLPNPSQHR